VSPKIVTTLYFPFIFLISKITSFLINFFFCLSDKISIFSASNKRSLFISIPVYSKLLIFERIYFKNLPFPHPRSRILIQLVFFPSFFRLDCPLFNSSKLKVLTIVLQTLPHPSHGSCLVFEKSPETDW